MMPKKLKILMASAEIAPFVKIGGLADVVGSLPIALRKLGCDVRLVMPLYGSVNRKKYKLRKIYSDLEVPSGKRLIKINLWQTNLPNSQVFVYFIEAEKYFKSKFVYCGNNTERFLFFSLAALYIIPIITKQAGQVKFKPDIVHCQDHHTALIPDILKTSNLVFLKDIKTLFTIHNLNYQGKTSPRVLSTGNLSKDSLASLSIDAQDNDINFMAQGILNADLINTVSKTYAKEITTPIYGAGLDNIIRKRKKDLYGIINGINTDFFNPATDKYIKQNYSIKTLTKKVNNKLDLQKKLGLKKNKEIALVGFISRLVKQKGLELITEEFSKLNCQFVFLGTGWKKHEKHLKNLAKKYPDKVSAQIMFDIKLARQIYAGADIFLMPSLFEPCGLGQMIAMRYGTVPVVRATGGLADTVDNLRFKIADLRFKNLSKATGFVFEKFDSNSFYQMLRLALIVYYQYPKVWRQLQINSMKKDFSWDKSAKEYVKLYKKLKH